MSISLLLLVLTNPLLENTVDLAASKKTTVVDLPLTVHPATTTVTEEDVIVTMTDEEVTPLEETNVTLQVVRTDLLLTTDTVVGVIVTEDLPRVVVTVTIMDALRGMIETETTVASRGGGIRGVLTLLPPGKGVPSEGRGLLLVTKSGKTTRRRIKNRNLFRKTRFISR